MTYFELTFSVRYPVSAEHLAELYGVDSLRDALKIDVENASAEPIHILEMADQVTVTGRVIEGAR